MIHELWEDPDADEGPLFVLAGQRGDAARALLSPNARVTWTVDAPSHFEAMTLYYQHMGWGDYSTDFPDVDKQTYAERGWE